MTAPALRVVRGTVRGALVQSGGELHHRVIHPAPRIVWASRDAVYRHGYPQTGLPRFVNEFREANWPKLWDGASRLIELLRELRELNAPAFVMHGALYVRNFRADGRVEDLGLVGLKVVTTAGVGYLVDGLQNLTEPENLKYHGIGTGTNAEASSDTALQTELTTQYSSDNTRPTGSQTEGAGANVYRTVGLVTVDASVAITEHGIFSQAATGGGTLLDRTVHAADNLASGDSYQGTYDLTIAAGS